MRKNIPPKDIFRWAFTAVASNDPFVNFPMHLESIGEDEDFALVEALKRADISPNRWQENHTIIHMWADNGDYLYGADIGWGTTWYKATKI